MPTDPIDLSALRPRPSRAARCPVCASPASREAAPFCSPRCKDVDLHRWLVGAYAIPAVEADDDGGTLDGQDSGI